MRLEGVGQDSGLRAQELVGVVSGMALGVGRRSLLGCSERGWVLGMRDRAAQAPVPSVVLFRLSRQTVSGFPIRGASFSDSI